MDTHSEVNQIAQILLFCLVPLTPSLWGDCISKEGEILCYFLRLKKASLEELLQMGSYPGRVLRPNDDTLPVFLSWFWSEWGLNKKYSWGLLDRCVENFHGHKWKKNTTNGTSSARGLLWPSYFSLPLPEENHYGNNGRKKDALLYLSLLNLRECRIAGIFCLRFHRWMLSSAKALTSAPWGEGQTQGGLSESTKDLVASLYGCFIST